MARYDVCKTTVTTMTLAKQLKVILSKSRSFEMLNKYRCFLHESSVADFARIERDVDLYSEYQQKKSPNLQQLAVVVHVERNFTENLETLPSFPSVDSELQRFMAKRK